MNRNRTIRRLKELQPHLIDSLRNAVPARVRDYPDTKLYLAIIEQCIKDIQLPPREYHRQACKAIPGKRPAHYRNRPRKKPGTVLEDYCYNAMVFLTEGPGIRYICSWIGLDYSFMRLQISRWLVDSGIYHDIGRMTYSEFYYK